MSRRTTPARPRPAPSVSKPDRVPPHDVDVEATFLGALMLLRPDRAAEAVAECRCTAADFYRPAHGHVFTAVLALVDEGVPAEPALVADELSRAGQLDAVGGKRRLLEVQAYVTASTSAVHYGRRVVELAETRRLIAAAGEIRDRAYDGGPLPELVDAARRALDRVTLPAAAERDDWAPVDLGPVVAGDAVVEQPTVVAMSNGEALLYAGRVHAFIGETESGKSWLAVEGARQELAAGGHVVYVDLEDSAAGVTGRLRALDVDPGVLVGRFHYVAPGGPLTPAAAAGLDDLVARLRPRLVVIDGVSETMALLGLEDRSAIDVAGFYRMLPRRLAALGPAVVLIDHVNKDREQRGRFATGSQHKLSGIDGAAYGVEAVVPFARGRAGWARLTVAKDRHGTRRRGDAVAELHVDSSSGTLRVELRAVEARATTPSAFRPTTLMEKISRALEQTPGLTARSLRTAVPGKNDTKDLALELLIAEGLVEVKREGSAHCHHVVRPFRASDEEVAS